MFQTMRTMGFKKLMYPIITVVFFCTVAIFFFFTVRFVVRMVNRVFTIDEGVIQSRVVAFDIDTFEKVKKRFALAPEGEVPMEIPTPSPTGIPVSSPSSAPTATPAPALEKSALKLQILNGSARKGQAAVLKGELEKQGFMVSNTGNADSVRYQKTLIRVKETKKDYVLLVQQELSGYELGDTETLSEDAVYDIIIVIGAR